MTDVVRLVGAAVDVGGHRLWSGLDLAVDPGEFVVVLGPNGVGKSTLMKAVLGVIPLASGQIQVLGRSPGAVRGRIGYLPQRRSFDSQLRVRGLDLVRLGLDGARWGVPWPGAARFTRRGRAAADRVAEVVELVGATAYAHRPIGEISGGEQQRLLIAQALAARPELLLLDEPLDSLDLPNQGAVAELVAQIAHREGVAVLMVAHDVNPLLPHLDRLVYLGSGGAVIGSPAEVITTEQLSRLYRSRVEVLRTSDDRLVVVGAPEAAAGHADRHAR